MGEWTYHGFDLTVNDDGTSQAIWRVYRWCGPVVPKPCDTLGNDRITSGGYADLSFSRVDDAGVLQGEVTSSTDAELLDVGPVTLTPQEYGISLDQGATQITLCGAHYVELAPQDVIDQSPCGA